MSFSQRGFFVSTFILLSTVPTLFSQAYADFVEITDHDEKIQAVDHLKAGFTPALPSQCMFASLSSGWYLNVFSDSFNNSADASIAEQSGKTTTIESRAYQSDERVYEDDDSNSVAIVADDRPLESSQAVLTFHLASDQKTVAHVDFVGSIFTGGVSTSVHCQ